MFWADGKGSTTPPGHWNQIAAQVAAAKGNSLSANARLFAQLNVALADAAIACWDAKYTYGLWRPETAIQNADVDGNAATAVRCRLAPAADHAAAPGLRVRALHLQRRSRHGAGRHLRRQHIVSTPPAPRLPGVTRSFTSFSAAAEEAGRSRIYGGIHFEFGQRTPASCSASRWPRRC